MKQSSTAEFCFPLLESTGAGDTNATTPKKKKKK